MNAKKWVLSLPVIVLILAALLAGFNYVTDPFGAFGDRFMQWFSYDETNNPRAAKISYLEQHHDEYDSYFLGCSSTSSLPTESFNEMLNAKFYNLIMYGADMKDCEQIANYLIDNYTVKNLVLNVYLDNGLTYDDESNKPGYVRAVVLLAVSPRGPAVRLSEAGEQEERHTHAAVVRRIRRANRRV